MIGSRIATHIGEMATDIYIRPNDRNGIYPGCGSATERVPGGTIPAGDIVGIVTQVEEVTTGVDIRPNHRDGSDQAVQAGAEKWQAGDESARKEVLNAANGYVDLLRAHIYKENNILFPLANDAIPLEIQEQVAVDFERIEHEETGEGVHEKYLALAEQLEAAMK
jgi:hypothetical protein